MLERVRHLADLGPFAKLEGPLDPIKTPDARFEFSKVCLIYARNGRGKSTFAELLRSIGGGELSRVHARTRVGATGTPGVRLTVLGSEIALGTAAWSTSGLSTQVFDEAFVEENVFSGLDVTNEHRRRMHEVVIGAEGVALAKKFNGLTEDIRALGKRRDALLVELSPSVLGTGGVNAFCQLKPDPDIDIKLAAARLTLDAQKDATAISSTLAFANDLTLERIDSAAIRATLGSTAAAAIGPKHRVERRALALGPTGNAWLAEAARHLTEDSCPVCLRAVAGVEGADDLRTYFGGEYATHTATLGTAVAEFASSFGTAAQQDARLTLGTEEEKLKVWRKFWPDLPDNFHLADLRTRWQLAHRAVEDLLNSKLRAPLDFLTMPIEAEAKIDSLNRLVDTVNDQLVSARGRNEDIASLKKSTASGTVSAAQAKVDLLTNTKNRSTAPLSDRCDAYCLVDTEIDLRKAEKELARVHLDEYTTKTFPTYEKRINGFLEKCEAGFRIELKGTVDHAGKTDATLRVVVAGRSVSAAEHDPRRQCFGTILSTGDRSTLGLAFFLAQFSDEADLSKTCFVFDDPVASLDESRRSRTCDAICRISKRAAQVFVLSHYALLLTDIWARLGKPTNGCNALYFERVPTKGVEFHVWAIGEASVHEFHKIRNRLKRFLEHGTGDSDHIAKSVCALLEAYLQVVDPVRLPFGDWLGTYVKRLRADRVGKPWLMSKRRFEALEDLDKWCGSPRHATSITGSPPPDDTDEIRSRVREALQWVTPDEDWS